MPKGKKRGTGRSNVRRGFPSKRKGQAKRYMIGGKQY